MSKEDACLSRLSCQPSSALLWVFFLVTAVAINGILTLSGLNPLRGKSFWCCCLVQLSDRRCHFFWESVFAMFDIHKTYMKSWCLISYWLAKADRRVHLWEHHFLAWYFNKKQTNNKWLSKLMGSIIHCWKWWCGSFPPVTGWEGVTDPDQFTSLSQYTRHPFKVSI